MTSLLRKIVAGPRSRHPEADLDLCYVTDNLIATSGPSSTYPQLAYRNPLEDLVKFLDSKHKDNWAIWEFRAEGTGYPDEDVYNRIWHYPWPDHHPPPFALIPSIMASMRNWLMESKKHVVVVHCKAGKGRSGTAACSYLISECGWKPSEALTRFTERRMRSGFGQGVSIPSQVRWINYVDQWTRLGKEYIERQVEIVQVHVWGLRDGVKVAVEGFIDQGKTIKNFHIFNKKERLVVSASSHHVGSLSSGLLKRDNKVSASAVAQKEANDPAEDGTTNEPSSTSSMGDATGSEVGGEAVIFRPQTPIVLPTNDVNIDFERRNKAGYGWTMVTSVAHVWFNAFFEGYKDGISARSGVFEIEWDAMDGIKGSTRKGIRALDRLAVVWRVSSQPSEGSSHGQVIHEPAPGEAVAQAAPADWKGGNPAQHASLGKDLGLRTESPASAQVSKASSIHSSSPPPESADAPLPDPANLPNVSHSAPEPDLDQVNRGLDTASSTTPAQTTPFGPGSPIERTESPAVMSDGGAGKTVAPPKPEGKDLAGIVQGMTDVHTADLPAGKPEGELQTAKEHNLGHFRRTG